MYLRNNGTYILETKQQFIFPNTNISVHNIVLNILDGNPADGTHPVSFTKHTAVRTQFATIAADIIDRVRRSGTELTDEQRTALIRKLATHCNRVGWQQPQTIGELDRIAGLIVDAVIAQPYDLTEPRNLQGMIRAHHARNGRHHKRHATPANTRPIFIDQLPGTYTLVELTTPEELCGEGEELGHCLAYDFNESALRIANLDKSNPRALNYLSYAMDIRNGRSRIFSLRDRLGACITLEYRTAQQVIAQANAHTDEKVPIEDQPYFPALCLAIDELRRQIPITALPFAPPPHDQELVCTYDGRWALSRDIPANDVLFGVATLDDNTPQANIEFWADNPLLWLDISNLSDRTRLPCQINASLKHAPREPWAVNDLPYLEDVANILDTSSPSLHLPSLRTFRTLTAWRADHISAPCLEYGNRLETGTLLSQPPKNIRKVISLHGGAFPGSDIGWPHYLSRRKPNFRCIPL